MIVALYVRVSTLQQVDRESLSNQESRLRAYCKANNYKIYKVYKDAGVSAKDTKRPALEELMEDAKHKKIEAVIVTKLDRITRSLKDLISLMEFFQKYQTKFISITQNIDTTGSLGRFMLNMLGSVAQLEREVTAERVSEDMYYRALAGKWNGGIIPYGYTTRQKTIKDSRNKGIKEEKILQKVNKLAPEPKRLYVNEEEAENVKKIYELYFEKRSLRATTNLLNKQGYRTRKGMQWAASSVQRILSNPTYTGRIWYGKRKTDLVTGKLNHVKKEDWKYSEGEHERIISDEVFNEVQKVLESRKQKPSRASRTYLLSGIIRCGKCGGPMYGYTCYKDGKKSGGKTYFYYKCHNYASKGKSVCSGLSIPGKTLEDFIIEKLMELSKDRKFLNDKRKMLETLKEEAKPRKLEKKEELKKLKSEEKKLEDKKIVLLEKLEDRVIDDLTFKERFTQIRSELEKNRMRQSEIEIPETDFSELALTVSFEEISDFKKNWEFLDDEGKRTKLQTIVKSVKVTEDKVDMEIFLDVNEVSNKLRDS